MTRKSIDDAGVPILGLHVRRPRLAAGVAAGLIVYAFFFWSGAVTGRLSCILAWDAGVLVALALFAGLSNTSPATMKRIADQQDAGKWAVLMFTLLAAGASLVAIAGEVPLIRHAAEMEKIMRIGLIIGTIVLSWTFIQAIFALHYAHDYYSSAPEGSGSDEAISKGLLFPGAVAPTYLDFAYFSFTIGMTFQVSDVQIADPDMRKLALTHGVISFFYATGILALTINMVGGLL